MYGKSLYSTNSVEMEYIEGVCIKMRFIVSSIIAMPQLMVDILDLRRLQLRCFKPVPIGPLSLKISRLSLWVMLNAKDGKLF